MAESIISPNGAIYASPRATPWEYVAELKAL